AESGEVADGLVEAVIRTAPEQVRLVLVGALVHVVAELVMGRVEVIGAHRDTGLHAQILFAVDVPGGGVTDDFAVPRPGDHGPLPETGRFGGETYRGIPLIG